MNDLEVVKCCELENLVMKIQNLISNIEKGDLGLQVNFLMDFLISRARVLWS